MSWSPFETRVSGKWVLAGEHAVLKGAPAIALPHPEFGLALVYRPSEGALRVVPSSAQGVVDDILRVVQEERKSNGRSFDWPQGSLEISSTIPIGAGLGSSAALCVAMGRWLSPFLGIQTAAELQAFATQLEHRFHGRSSGMDVAVIVAGEPISFVMSDAGKTGAQAIGVKKLPRFTFHDTGLRARTSDCVAKVEAFRKKDPRLGAQLDVQMSSASKMALDGLIRYDAVGSHDANAGSALSHEALETIARAMRNAQECYEAWQLVPSEARAIQEKLLAEGALATKITGAGDGGMIVALWE